MLRLIHAMRHSARAFGCLIRSEAAFRQEAALLVAALPLAWFLASTWRSYLLLIGSLLFLMLVEVLNTAIEAACDAVSTEFRPEIKLAKDCGSLAVLMAIVLAGGVWLLALCERFVGAPL